MGVFSANNRQLLILIIFYLVVFNSLEVKVSNNTKHFVFDFNPKAIAQSKNGENKLIAKSSGGRSGGGSFKKRKKGSSGTNSRKNSSPRPTYNSRPRTISPSRPSSPSYRNNYSNRTRSNSNGFALFLFLLIFGGGTLAVVLIAFKSIFLNSENKSDPVLNNNTVTLSKLQVALLADAKEVQKQLSELSLRIDTDTDAGLIELLRESVLVLLRNSDYWNYVLSSSVSLHIDKAESEFQKLSIAERSKFSAETFSNFDGQIRQSEAIEPDENDIAAYILVTLILGTADDKPLFEKIHSKEELQTVLENLASTRDDYLMKFELLWSPQSESDSLTYDELITEYTDMIKLF